MCIRGSIYAPESKLLLSFSLDRKDKVYYHTVSKEKRNAENEKDIPAE